MLAKFDATPYFNPHSIWVFLAKNSYGKIYEKYQPPSKKSSTPFELKSLNIKISQSSSPPPFC